MAVSVDVEAESIAGVAELMLTPPSDVLTEVTESGWTIALNCCEAYEDGSGLTVYQVTIDGAVVQFKVEVADRSVAPVSLDGAGPAETALRGAVAGSDAGTLRISAPADCLRRVSVRADLPHACRDQCSEF